MLGIQVGSDIVGIGAGVPSGVSAAILIGGINDMTIAQKLGASWEVKDPDGQAVDSYFDWAVFHTPAGQEHGFVGNRFILDKLGTYTVEAELLMNPDDPVVVDSYEGDLCTVTTEVPPEYDLIQHTIYPYAYIYDGDQESTTATFRTDPFVPSAWLADKFASKLEEEVRARGGRPLEVKVYVDTTPLLWTDFRIDVSSTPIGGVAAASGIAVGIPVWLAIILVCLAITAVIVVATLAIKTIVGLFKTYPGLEDVKPAWGKETLILTIQDAEEFWERPLTPADTLEGMSEEELRHLLNQIAEEEVREEVDWGALAIVGGIALLGVGAASVFVLRKK